MQDIPLVFRCKKEIIFCCVFFLPFLQPACKTPVSEKQKRRSALSTCTRVRCFFVISFYSKFLHAPEARPGTREKSCQLSKFSTLVDRHVSQRHKCLYVDFIFHISFDIVYYTIYIRTSRSSGHIHMRY